MSLRFTRKLAEHGEALGRSRGGLGTKLVGVCDAGGRLLDFLLAPGQAHELAPSLALLRRLPDTPSWVLADRACDAGAFRAEMSAAGATPVVPSRRGAKDPQPCPDYIYRHRNLIERCWSRLKERRAVAVPSRVVWKSPDRRVTGPMRFVALKPQGQAERPWSAAQRASASHLPCAS